MKVRSGLLLTCATGSLLIGIGALSTRTLAADMPVKAAPIESGWWYSGYLEVGGRGFLNNPRRDGQWSAGLDSLAKYYEYSTIKPGAYFDGWASAGSRDGLYRVDLWAKNVGYSDQKYEADVSKIGEHYLSLGWDQTPHVYSTSAQTIYNGFGTTALWLPAGLSNTLALNSACGGAGAPGCANLNASQADAVRTTINNNLHGADIGIRRDTASVEYRYTPSESWDFRANYSDMKRSGTQIDNLTFSWSTSGVMSQVAKPVSDRTQNYGASGEYIGTSLWGQKFNAKVAYAGSTFDNDYNSYTVENPFCTTGATTCYRTSAPLARMTLAPSNQMNSVSGTVGADLPLKSRYMGTVSYVMMRQNEAFLPFTINPNLGNSVINGQPLNSTSALPAASLNGAINTLLVNNVVTTEITPELKSKLSYRYYNFDNNTPELLVPQWVGADITAPTLANPGGGNYKEAGSAQASYTKQNAGAELTWRPSRQWNLGLAYLYERYDRTRADVDVTNENGAKAYVDWKPTSGVTARASWLFAARRYDNYNNFGYLAQYMWPTLVTPTNVIQNQAYRQLNYADRDRNQGKFSVSVDLAPNVVVTPSVGIKDDRYLNTKAFGNLTTTCAGVNCIYNGTYYMALDPTQPGLQKDYAWNWGGEVAIVVNPDLTFMFSYTREHRDQEVIYCGGQSCNSFSSTTGAPSSGQDARMRDLVDTFIARARYDAIPDKLQFDVGYTWSLGKGDINLSPGPFSSLSSGAVTVLATPFPDTKTTFQRLDAVTLYKLDDELVRQLGWSGTVKAKVRYAWERSRVTNWQNDSLQTYMWSVNNVTLGYMTWLGAINPNYDVHLISGAIAFQW